MAETTEQYRNRINQLKTSIENEPYMKNMRPDIAEGISKTGNRQADIEVRQNTLEDDFVAVQQDARSNTPSGAELAVAAGNYNTLGERLDVEEQKVTAQFAQTESDLNTIAVVAEKDTLMADVSNAVNGDATVVTTKNEEYVVTENLYPLAESVVMTGRGKITHLNHNNRYFDIFDPRHSSGVLPSINPSHDSANMDKFRSALATAKSGGAKVKITFVGDSLTQSGHRKNDHFSWVEQLKTKLIERFGDYFIFYNRGWAGRIISELNEVISEPLNAPFEQNWVTSSGSKTWFQYISDTNPDVVIVAFGTNEQNADSYNDIANARISLNGIPSNPSIVWVTSPITTINTEALNSGNYFGRYPTNEFPNTAGIVTRTYAQRKGDAVIDVNRQASIAMLGLDPYQYRMDRWAGLYRKTENQFIAPEGTVTGGESEELTISVLNKQSIETQRLFRNSVVEFTPTGNLDATRIWFRRDSSSDSYTMIELSNGVIKLYGKYVDTLSMGEIVSWMGDCRNKRTRVEVIGTTVKVFINDSKVLEYNDNLASQFLAPITIQALNDTTNATLSNVFINGDYYKKYMPRISANEAYSVSFGDGGNGLNHPNTRGELEFYTQPINEFIDNLRV